MQEQIKEALLGNKAVVEQLIGRTVQSITPEIKKEVDEKITTLGEKYSAKSFSEVEKNNEIWEVILPE